MKTYPGLWALSGPLLAVMLGCHVRFSSDGYQFDYRGQQAQRTESGEIPAGIEQITIDNQYGAVKVEPAVEGDAMWTWEVTSWAETSERAEALLEQVRTQQETRSAEHTASWKLVLPDPPARDLRGIRSNLTLKVPLAMRARIANRGDVDLRGLQGEIDVENRHGDVAVQGLSGPCQLKNQHGDMIVHQVASARLSNRHGNTSVQGVSDDLRLESEHGVVEVKNVRGGLAVSNRHGKVVVDDVQGNVDIHAEHAGIDVRNLQAAVTLENAHGPIRAESVQGNASVRNRHGKTELDLFSTNVSCRCEHGSLKLALHNPEIQRVRAETSHASIEVVLPKGFDQSVVASADHGKIESDVPVVSSLPSDDTEYLFQARHGNITIQKAPSAHF